MNITNLSQQELQFLLNNLSNLTPSEQQQVAIMLEELEKRNYAKKCQQDLIAFCQHIDPSYIVAAHHRKLAELLVEIAFGQKDRIAVSVPPRHGKSHLVSTLFPAWFLGKFPDKKVLMVSNTAELAVDFGRKVRNIIADPRYQAVFPGISLSSDSKSAGRWSTNRGGEYFATGVGGALAGRGADLLLVDDPHDEQDLLAGNFDALDKAYQWFTFGARTRLMSGGRIAIVHCMTGDTPVLMADGAEKPLRDVRPGDVVASHDAGVLVPAKVLNWANQGTDRIYAIKMKSGTVVRANERHPFLVDREGAPEWIKVKNLKVGESILKVTGGSGAESVAAQMDVTSQPTAKGCVSPTTTNMCGQRESTSAAVMTTGMPISSTDTASTSLSTTVCSKSKTASAPYATNPQTQATPLQTGTESSRLTTATAEVGSEPFCATTATSSSRKATQKKHYCGPLSTYELTLDEIVEIVDAGYEDVFDIQVEGTENFIANSLVSHNTRWHQDDLIGRLTKDAAKNEKADQYEVFEFPAVLDITKERVNENGEVEQVVTQKALWPEKFDLEALERTKASMPSFQWNAQYMQSPTSEEAAIIKRDWWQLWEKDSPPPCEYVIMTLDAAAEKHNRADYTALTTWGVFSDDNLTDGASHLILLNAIKIRVEFPELKDLAYREWKDWSPDSFIVEKKSAGTQLYQELRRAGIPVQEFTPGRNTGDKIARLNAVADIIRSGMVWVPAGRRWAEELVEECVAFPFGSNDDLVDCTSMALARFRSGGFITLPTDYKDDELLRSFRRKVAYY